jgi:hypothetical protein
MECIFCARNWGASSKNQTPELPCSKSVDSSGQSFFSLCMQAIHDSKKLETAKLLVIKELNKIYLYNKYFILIINKNYTEILVYGNILEVTKSEAWNSMYI